MNNPFGSQSYEAASFDAKRQAEREAAERARARRETTPPAASPRAYRAGDALPGSEPRSVEVKETAPLSSDELLTKRLTASAEIEQLFDYVLKLADEHGDQKLRELAEKTPHRRGMDLAVLQSAAKVFVKSLRS